MTDLPAAVSRIWKNREAVEAEAELVFHQLASDLHSVWGEGDAVAALALQAADEERHHGVLCRKILGVPEDSYTPPDYRIQLGPSHLSRQQRLVYSAMAMSCITETLSTALLLEMKNLARPGLIKDTVHTILSDEVRHARIGWAEISRNQGDLKWLEPYIPDMLQEALESEVRPMLSAEEGAEDYSEFGVLPPKMAQELMQTTVNDVIVPALKQFDIQVNVTLTQ